VAVGQTGAARGGGGSYHQRSLGSWRRRESWRKTQHSDGGRKGISHEDQDLCDDAGSPLKVLGDKTTTANVPRKLSFVDSSINVGGTKESKNSGWHGGGWFGTSSICKGWTM
jgi:hypothetical protein